MVNLATKQASKVFIREQTLMHVERVKAIKSNLNSFAIKLQNESMNVMVLQANLKKILQVVDLGQLNLR
jgi:hypothetical protein